MPTIPLAPSHLPSAIRPLPSAICCAAAAAPVVGLGDGRPAEHMRLKTWLVAALGLGSLVLLIVVSMLASSRKAQDIYAQLDKLNTHHRLVEATLRRLRSD